MLEICTRVQFDSEGIFVELFVKKITALCWLKEQSNDIFDLRFTLSNSLSWFYLRYLRRNCFKIRTDVTEKLKLTICLLFKNPPFKVSANSLKFKKNLQMTLKMCHRGVFLNTWMNIVHFLQKQSCFWPFSDLVCFWWTPRCRLHRGVYFKLI